MASISQRDFVISSPVLFVMKTARTIHSRPSEDIKPHFLEVRNAMFMGWHENSRCAVMNHLIRSASKAGMMEVILGFVVIVAVISTQQICAGRTGRGIIWAPLKVAEALHQAKLIELSLTAIEKTAPRTVAVLGGPASLAQLCETTCVGPILV
jgi:hypothetical protein